MSEWQPIETAPKDREILLWFPWDLPPGNPQGAPPIASPTALGSSIAFPRRASAVACCAGRAM
jgi:hypothetical protein